MLSPVNPMIVVVGTGALATLFAARLGRVGPVTILGSWAEAITAINRDGLRLAGEDDRPVRVAATADPADCAGAGLALVLVKAPQTPQAARLIQQFLSPDGLALTLQNGLGNFETLRAGLGAERAALGVTTQGATLLGPGLARDANPGRGLIHLAEHARLEPLAGLLRAAGFETRIHPAGTLQGLVWGKLVVNCAINPLTALLRVANGELLERPDALAVMDAAAGEAAAVAGAQAIRLPFAEPAQQARAVAEATASNFSSMLQDVRRGVPTEIEAINGAVVRAGQAAGLAAPVNETLLHLVKALEPGGTAGGRG
jgi:2-dehydropantoate 2-reductase